MRKSEQLSLTAIFAALHTVLYLLSVGLWRNWAIYIAPLEGIILGPQVGFIAALLGSSIARTIRPDVFWMFGIIAEPLSVLMVGLLAQAKWKIALVIYGLLLSSYFAHPFGQSLPLWTILDILLAAVLIYPAARLAHNLSKRTIKSVTIAVVVIAFVCTATDSLIRVFLLVPVGLRTLFFSNYETLYAVFVGSAISSYIEDVLVVVVSLFVGVPVVLRMPMLRSLITKTIWRTKDSATQCK